MAIQCQGCGNLNHQDTNSANHRSSFPCVVGSSPPYHLRRHRLSRDEQGGTELLALLLACLRVASKVSP
jgi:hypothetical protein